MKGINPFIYLKDVLPCIASHPINQIELLLPQNWMVEVDHVLLVEWLPFKPISVTSTHWLCFLCHLTLQIYKALGQHGIIV